MIIDAEPVYRCPDCFDTGYASVVDPRYWPKSLRSVAVICNCSEGDSVAAAREKRTRTKPRAVARLNNQMAVFRPGMNRDDATAAIADVKRIENHRNYEPAFNDYNQERF
jgi:hypothetical protein